MKSFPTTAAYLRSLALGLALSLAGGCATAPHSAYLDGTSGDQDVFTMIALPDTQYYAARRPEAFESQTRWIAENVSRLNIRTVLGLGDIVDNGADPQQWANAAHALATLKKAGIPHFMAIGNHDYDGAYLETPKLDRDVVGFNRNFGPDYYDGMAGYGGSLDNSHENFFATFRGARRDYLAIALEFSPRDRALAWADGVIAAHPNHELIFFTHSYLYNNGLRVTRCANHTKRAYGMDTDNDGEEIWAKLVSKYPRARLVLSGHIPKIGVARHFALGAGGNVVNELLSDFQNYPHEGDGWLRILTFKPDSNRVEVSTYSPYLAEHPELAEKGADGQPTGPWKSDALNQFTLDYERPAPMPFGSGTIQGIVRSYGDQDRCKPIAGVTVRFQGGIAVTDAEGKFTAIISGKRLGKYQSHRSPYQPIVMEASKPGWETASVVGTARTGADNAEQIYLVPVSAN